MDTHNLLVRNSVCFAALLVLASSTACAGDLTEKGNSDVQQPQTPSVQNPGSDINQEQSSAFNTPEDDGRPGVYYFDVGAQAAKRSDYSHAFAMYKVAASWAYKPADYNLAVMYLQGQGVPVDLPRAMAWMALAAERNDAQFVKARDLVHAQMTQAQVDQANVILHDLLPVYGDKVALARAETRWREAKMNQTGSRVGSSGTRVLVGGAAGVQNHMNSPNYDVGAGGHVGTNPQEVAGVIQTDGVVAYQQLHESNNPYDPKFQSGTVTVGALSPATSQDSDAHKSTTDQATDSQSH